MAHRHFKLQAERLDARPLLRLRDRDFRLVHFRKHSGVETHQPEFRIGPLRLVAQRLIEIFLCLGVMIDAYRSFVFLSLRIRGNADA